MECDLEALIFMLLANFRDTFDEGDYRILFVANKFRTGFEQLLLWGI
jgi:hypothetical protein